jgi:hypothetical protein
LLSDLFDVQVGFIEGLSLGGTRMGLGIFGRILACDYIAGAVGLDSASGRGRTFSLHTRHTSSMLGDKDVRMALSSTVGPKITSSLL